MIKSPASKKLEKEFDRAFYRIANGIQIPMMSLCAMTYYGIGLMESGMETDEAVRQAVEKYKCEETQNA